MRRTLSPKKIRTALFLIVLFLTNWLSSQTPLENAQSATALNKLADDFWTWRARNAPFTGDDVNRMERPGGVRDWSLAKIDNHRKELAEFDAREARVVELRYFGGLSVEETAEVLGITPVRVKRDWKTAKAWLYGVLTAEQDHISS